MTTLFRRAKTERARVKLERSGEVRGEIAPVVTSGIKMKFMWDAAGSERVVESLRAFLETIIIFRATVKVNFEAR